MKIILAKKQTTRIENCRKPARKHRSILNQIKPKRQTSKGSNCWTNICGWRCRDKLFYINSKEIKQACCIHSRNRRETQRQTIPPLPAYQNQTIVWEKVYLNVGSFIRNTFAGYDFLYDFVKFDSKLAFDLLYWNFRKWLTSTWTQNNTLVGAPSK